MKATGCFLVFAMLVCVIAHCRNSSPTGQQLKSIREIISIKFDQPNYTFTLNQASQGIQIPYSIVITENVDTVYAIQLATCARPDSSGLIPLEVLSGNGQEYCKCDNGFCSYMQGGYLSKLRRGNYPYLFQWTGRNWNGPSDTGNPLGNPFPAGDYVLTVRVKGESKANGIDEVFAISDSVKVHLTE
jgi:hypothetical protein